MVIMSPQSQLRSKEESRQNPNVEALPRAGGQNAGSKPLKALIWGPGWAGEKAMPAKAR